MSNETDPRTKLSKLRADGMITEDEFATEDGRLAKAQAAGRDLAAWEQKHGHTEPRANWDKGGTRNAGARAKLRRYRTGWADVPSLPACLARQDSGQYSGRVHLFTVR